MGRALSIVPLMGMVLLMSCKLPTLEEDAGTSLPARDTIWIDVSNAEILEHPFLHAALLLMAGMERAPDSLRDSLEIALQTLLEDPRVSAEMKAFMEGQNMARSLHKTGGWVCTDTVRGLPFSNEIFQVILCIEPEITGSVKNFV